MNNKQVFWISYSDLMTSMFFIMLVLFVIALGYYNYKISEIEVTVETYEKVLQLQKQFEPLIADTSNFMYLPDCKKFVAKKLSGIEIFLPNESTIKDEYIPHTIEAGKNIELFVKKLINAFPHLSYMIVIEGNMANSWDKRISKDMKYGYNISFQRALAVYNLWLRNGINLRQGDSVEILICGSGFSGLCREKIEENNKRFSIQIIPKVDKIEQFE